MRRIGTAISPMRYRTIPTEGVDRVTKAIDWVDCLVGRALSLSGLGIGIGIHRGGR